MSEEDGGDGEGGFGVWERRSGDSTAGDVLKVRAETMWGGEDGGHRYGNLLKESTGRTEGDDQAQSPGSTGSPCRRWNRPASDKAGNGDLVRLFPSATGVAAMVVLRKVRTSMAFRSTTRYARISGSSRNQDTYCHINKSQLDCKLTPQFSGLKVMYQVQH